MPALLLLGLLSLATAAPPTVPSRQIPPSVLVELQVLENRFELALAADCDPAICSSKGCVWLEHAVADRPSSRSMPGLATEAGPSSTGAQEYLTRAECSFAHEGSLDSAQAAALVRRLQTRLTHGWTVVSVDHELLQPLPPPAVVEEAVPEPDPVEEAPPPEAWGSVAANELWTALLPHFFWMIGLGLFSMAAAFLIWSWRRVGRASAEEQALLAQLANPEPEAVASAEVSEEAGEAGRAFVAEQEANWKARLEAIDPEHPDLELQALIRERLRAGDLPLLAKAILHFPENFPAAFPSDGEIATAKIELAELLQSVDPSTLPDDEAFFSALQRHTLAATLSTQPDARIVRSLREDFGAAGLMELIGRLPTRVGALLFAHAPPVEQQELVRLLAPSQVVGLADQLLRSNRMDPTETRALFAALGGAAGAPLGPPPGQITDRGTTFDATGALAVLLTSLSRAERSALFSAALARAHGSLPAWTRGILTGDMLLVLSPEARADLLLELEAEPLAAWFSLLDSDLRRALLEGLPDSLRLAIQASSAFPSRTRQLALAGRGRRELARGFQRQLARAGIPFERVVQPHEDTDA